MARSLGHYYILVIFFSITIIFIDVNDTAPVLSNIPFTGDGTFFDTGLGACGRVNNNAELIFALSAEMFDPSPGGNPNLNPNCGRLANVMRGDKSVTVMCVDRCVGCKSGDIDLSPTAFNQIATPQEGRVQVTWQFIN
ncbi:5574_t:CDS:1 [Funneliformis geosporum]|uniref:2601_t:CDS:1 n=1 Tax=Funneliformis geosporum TaxID=1117311 RepID=A0A9W4SL07_9GLOM|nr:5574_t:CDS:1 [Funneliformis geosporum]CAI2173850.1 2601_t:CDS:1 [Funneliformis geosporum]